MSYTVGIIFNFSCVGGNDVNDMRIYDLIQLVVQHLYNYFCPHYNLFKKKRIRKLFFFEQVMSAQKKKENKPLKEIILIKYKCQK